MATNRWMVFVDGENFTLRAQEIAARLGLSLDAAPEFFQRDVFVWLPEFLPLVHFYEPFNLVLDPPAIRAYYYASVVGDEDRLTTIREALRGLTFEPKVFKKESGTRRSKGVDIALTKDMLSHAFLGNYDAAVLVAGDGDYLPLIEEVKSLGKNVYVAFFTGEGSGLSREIRLAADRFEDLLPRFVDSWQKWAEVVRRQSEKEKRGS